jgi:hypothetical protein
MIKHFPLYLGYYSECPGVSRDIRCRSGQQFQMPLCIWNRCTLSAGPGFALGKLPTDFSVHQG